MGIPSFFSYIVKNHPDIIKKLQNNTIQINNLYLDCNSIIYDVVHNTDFSKLVDTDVNTIIKSVCSKIDEYIGLIKPDNSVFIAFDGVAPVAKLEQQRSRRYKSAYQNFITKTIYNKVDATDPWNTTAITPGTKFMSHLNTSIQKYFNNPKKYNLKNIILSTSENPGEGEHKLFQYIRDHPEKHKNETTVIYGLDADLIMLSINHLPISKNIYLFRETPHFIQSISSELEPNATYLLDIPELAEKITLNMNNGFELSKIQQKNRIYDYIFICFFLGNDFMPHFPSINIRTGGVDKMINAYKATIGSTNENLVFDNKIIWRNVRKLIQYLSELEHDNFKQEMKLRNKIERKYIPNSTPEEKLKKFESVPIYERQVEKMIDPFKPGWEERYYKQLFDVEYSEERIKSICINYLEALEWTTKYYTTGCSDWRWCYKYNYPPLLKDLIHYVPYFDTEFVSQNETGPVTALVQLCYVLPLQSLSLLPNSLYANLMKEHPEWYKSDCTFQWAFCKYFWESHVELPEIEIAELERFVSLN
jgi:5'-3' exoribonuclease 1